MTLHRHGVTALRRWLAAAAGLLIATSCLTAQPTQARVTESNSPTVRGECVARAQLLRNERITRSNASRIRDLRQCRESAGGVLPAAWLTAEPDSNEIATLILASSWIRDRRISNVLEAILRDERRDPFVRQAAAVVLCTYVRRNLMGSVMRSTVPGERWIIDIGLGSFNLDDAPEPPDSALRSRLDETLETIAGPRPRRTSLQKVAEMLLAYLRA